MSMNRAAVMALALVCGSFGCDDDDDDDGQTTTEDPSTVNDGGGLDAAVDGGADAATDGGAGDGGTAQELEDQEIFEIVSTANLGEVEQGRAALEVAEDAQVRDFATDMVESHTAAQARLEGLLGGDGGLSFGDDAGTGTGGDGGAQTNGDAGVPTSGDAGVQTNQIAEQLQRASDEIVAELRRPGTDKDKYYIDSQVTVHRSLLELLNSTLIPDAENDELVSELRTMRGEVQQHLTRARELADQFDGG